MLKLTKTGIGLLTKQYRSVLQKCWAINVGIYQAINNATSWLGEKFEDPLTFSAKTRDDLVNLLKTSGVGLFILGATAIIPNEAGALTADDLRTSDNITWTKVNATGSNVITVNDGTNTEYWQYAVNQSAYGTSYKNRTNSYNINTSNDYIAGAVYSYTSSTATNITNGLFYNNNISYTNASTSNILGISFYNSGVIDKLDVDQVNDIGTYVDKDTSWKYTRGNFYSSGTIGEITGDFINNSLTHNGSSAATHVDWAYLGGAAMWLEGNVGNITGNFIGNKSIINSNYGAGIHGGALYLNGIIGDITGNFIANDATVISGNYGLQNGGGAIAIAGGTVGNIKGDFIGNSLGGQTNYGFAGNWGGGAIFNNGMVNDIIGNFYNNKQISSKGGAIASTNNGGAISNTKYIHSIMGNFIGNGISNTKNSTTLYSAGYQTYSSSASGGAIYNTGTLDKISGTFNSNTVVMSQEDIHSNETGAYGGAVYNSGQTSIEDSVFQNNSVSAASVAGSAAIQGGTSNNAVYAYGGAIYNSNAINIKNSTFKANTVTATGGRVATALGGGMYNTGTATFTGTNSFSNNRANNVLNDIYNDGTININSGTTTLNSGYNSTAGGILNISSGATLDINENNGGIRTTNLGVVTIGDSGSIKLAIDVNNSNQSDVFTFAIGSSGSVIIDEINKVNALSNGKSYTVLSGGGVSTISVFLGSKARGESFNFALVNADSTWNSSYSVTGSGFSLNGGTLTYGSLTMTDVLAILNQATNNEVKYLTANSASNEITATDHMRRTKGDLTVEGVVDGENRSTINLGTYRGFELDDASSELTLKDLAINGGNTYLAQLNNADAKLNLSNAIVDGANIINYAGTINLIDATVRSKILNYDKLVSDPTIYEAKLYNYSGATADVDSDTFRNINSGSENGGAIYNEGLLNLTDAMFNNNVANGRYNDIYNIGTVNLNATEGNSITFGGSIEGTGVGTININSENLRGGTYVFSNGVGGNDVNIGSEGATNAAYIKMARKVQEDNSVSSGYFNNVATLTNYIENSILDTRNETIEVNSIDNLILNENLKLVLDAELNNQTIDSLLVENYSGGGSLIIDAINVLTAWDSPSSSIEIQVTDNDNLKSIYDLSDDFLSNMDGAEIFENASYDKSSGILTLFDKVTMASLAQRVKALENGETGNGEQIGTWNTTKDSISQTLGEETKKYGYLTAFEYDSENEQYVGTVGDNLTALDTALSLTAKDLDALSHQLYNYYYTFRVDERTEVIEFTKELRSNKKEMSSLDFMPIKSSSDLRINLIKAEDPLTFSAKTRDDSLVLMEVCYA